MIAYDPSNIVLSFINNLIGGLNCANHLLNLFALRTFGRTVDSASVWAAGGGYISFMVDNACCNLLIRYDFVPCLFFDAGFWNVFQTCGTKPSLQHCLLAVASGGDNGAV